MWLWGGLSDSQWQQWSLGRAWAGPRSCSSQCWLGTSPWCLPSTLYPSWLKEEDGENRAKMNRGDPSWTSEGKWQCHWSHQLTCNIYFSGGQGSQVRRGKCIETPSIHLGHTITSEKFVVEVQAHLDRDNDTFNAHLLSCNLQIPSPPHDMYMGRKIFIKTI